MQTDLNHITEEEFRLSRERSRDPEQPTERAEAYYQLCRFYRGEIFLREYAERGLELIRMKEASND